MNKVVTDFLHFARPRKPDLQLQPLNAIVESLQNMVEGQAYLKGVKTRFEYTGQENTVAADTGQIKQVILNMVRNALEAMEGMPEPRLAIETGSRPTGERTVRITNNGAPIPEDIRAQLGTPFLSTKDRGTGLGLSVCYQIVKEHGGRIEVDSCPGGDTSFTIVLPAEAVGNE